MLNLGVEGMMVMGAVAASPSRCTTGSPWLGVLAGILAGALFSLLFGFLTLTLATNQVATGLALTLLGLGLSGMIGESFVGLPGIKLPSLHIPGLSDLPFVGKLIFGQDPIFYLSIALTAGVAWFLFRTRAGLTLRSVGDNHGSAHALGINVIRIRYLAVMFGGACAGLAGAHLSLVYTPQWVENMTAGPRLDRAGAGRLRLLAAVARARRRLSVRRGHDRPAARAGAGHRHAFAVAFFASLSGDHRRARSNLAQQAADDDQHAGLARAAVRARPLGNNQIGNDEPNNQNLQEDELNEENYCSHWPRRVAVLAFRHDRRARPRSRPASSMSAPRSATSAGR